MNLTNYEWPKITGADLAFPTANVTKELLTEAENRNPKKCWC